MEQPTAHKFQVDLRGIIDLLSNHLYSGPEVYLRELLQNAVDAIRARTQIDASVEGTIRVEILNTASSQEAGEEGEGEDRSYRRRPSLMVQDNGVGLTEEEIHRFLATIGQSSKRDRDQPKQSNDFIGQFGIGLLSGFVVSEEIVVITRSARGESPALEWRGRQDGTYAIRTLSLDVEPGTRVFLTCKAGREEYFQPDRVGALLEKFGGLLPYPIHLSDTEGSRLINDEPAPWRQSFADPQAQRLAFLEYGKRSLGLEAFDAIELQSQAGRVEGIAFVLPYAPNLATRPSHRVYLKNILLSEQAEKLLPDWAFFVKCVINADDLRPTASREAFYEDETLEAAREALGASLRDYLIELADSDPQRLQWLIGLHCRAIKALAVQDDEFYRIFIDWLPFETSLGEMTLGEYRMTNPVVRYVPNLDQFRQIARVAAAQDLCVVNGGYVYNAELLEKFEHLFPNESTEIIDPDSLIREFEDLDTSAWPMAQRLLDAAEEVLEPYGCAAELKRFSPEELPALYSTTAEGTFLRSVEQAKEVSDETWANVLENLSDEATGTHQARICFNYNNAMVRQLAQLEDRQAELRRRAIEMLYVQALLLGHHPLNSREMLLLNQGLIGLIQLGLNSTGE